MKKILKSRMFSFFLGALMFCFLSVVFAYSYIASDIGFDSLDQTWNVDNVRDALDYLKHNQIYGKYSLTEREIGTWINGKRIYERVIPVSMPSSNSAVVAHNIQNFGGLVKMDLIWYDTDDKRWFTGIRYYYGNNSGYSIAAESFSINETYIMFSGFPNTINWQNRTSNAYVIIQYYKTTD